MTELRSINDKQVFICEKHNEVLRFWETFKNDRPNILSFDHHNDTHRAFQSKLTYNKYHLIGELIKRLKNGEMDLINELKNDEHVDAAIRCDFIDKALLFTCTSSQSNIEYLLKVSECEEFNEEKRILINTNLLFTGISIETDVLRPEIERFGLCLPAKDWNNNYILDIDLDFFHYKKSIVVNNSDFFKGLIKGAAISIARESVFIEDWKKQFDPDLSVEFLESELLNLIRKA